MTVAEHPQPDLEEREGVILLVLYREGFPAYSFAQAYPVLPTASGSRSDKIEAYGAYAAQLRNHNLTPPISYPPDSPLLAVKTDQGCAVFGTSISDP